MRALILMLVTLNLALAAWSWYYDKLSNHERIVYPIAAVPEVLENSQRAEAVEQKDAGVAQRLQAEQKVEAPEVPLEVVPNTLQREPKTLAEKETAGSSGAGAGGVEGAKRPIAAPPPAVKEDQDVEQTAQLISVEPSETNDALQVEKEASSDSCIMYGPFKRSAEADRLMQKLKFDGYTGDLNRRNESVHRGRWVLFPVADTTEAQALIAALNEEGLEDFGLVRKSPLGMAVSAGLYAGDRSLNARLGTLMRAGFTPKVDNLYREGAVYRVLVQEIPTNPEKYGKFIACNT